MNSVTAKGTPLPESECGSVSGTSRARRRRDEDNNESSMAILKCERMFRSRKQKSRAVLPVFSIKWGWIIAEAYRTRPGAGIGLLWIHQARPNRSQGQQSPWPITLVWSKFNLFPPSTRCLRDPEHTLLNTDSRTTLLYNGFTQTFIFYWGKEE